ncbi:hypothetical protein [Sphingomonas sp.]|uniref:hypothetical protein n=1 Tax=Sphingomonas sp. TaxID=28214 RepID=UPI003D6D87A4
MDRINWLIAAGVLNTIAALLHLGCVFGGPSWYRFFGAGEGMARLAEQGSWRPALITLGITAILAGWAAYAFSGAGLVPRLPLLRPALILICAVYVARAAAYPVMLARMPGHGTTFLQVSSAIVLVFAVVHAIGIWTRWDRL